MREYVASNGTALHVITYGNEEPREHRDLREALELAEMWLDLPAEERSVVQRCAREEKHRAEERKARGIQYHTHRTEEYNDTVSGNIDDPYIWLQHLKKTAAFNTLERISVWSGIRAAETTRAQQSNKHMEERMTNLRIVGGGADE
jgi:hypothetical protein